MNILIVNGPNLNLLGKREPEIYGNTSFEDYMVLLKRYFPEDNIVYFQSNSEGGIIDILHEYGFGDYGIILNAGGYSHGSIAILDAVQSINVPVIEVHISNIFKREPFRNSSVVAKACKGSIVGFGLDVYRLAVYALRG